MDFTNSTLRGILRAWLVLFACWASGELSAQTHALGAEQTESGPSLIVPSAEIRDGKAAGTLETPVLAIENAAPPPATENYVEAASNRNNCLIEVETNIWTEFPSNDDGSLGPITLPFDFDLYGESYNQVFINNNGNITFDNGYWWYSPFGFPISTPMIAPFWGDVDTRTGDGEVWYLVTDNAFYVSWNNVGPYNAYSTYSDGLSNTFQVILTDGTDPILDPGYNVGFRYGDMNWTTGSASSGANGFGGTPATVGVNSGNGTDYILLGLFDEDTDNYDGPSGDNDGVNWLAGQCFDFDVSSNVNLPPTAVEFPANNTIELCAGATTDIDISFTGPESNETVSIAIDDQGNGGYTINSNTSGNPGIMNVTIGPLSPGTYQYVFTGTDNNASPESTSRTLTVEVADISECGDAEPCTFEINSSDGYTVHVELYPVSIVVPETCNWGYNYDVQISYDISFSGDNIPTNLWSLQATLECGAESFFVDLPNGGGEGFANTISNQWTSDTDCDTATPESRECTDFALTIHGPGINSQTLDCNVVYPEAQLDCPDDIVITDSDEDCEEDLTLTAPTVLNVNEAAIFNANYLQFNDNQDRIAVTDLFYQGFYNEHTVETWIRTTNQNNQIIASFDRSEYWRIEINGNGGGNGQVGWCVNTNSGIEDMGSETRVDDGEWHHIVAVYDNGSMRIFIDGVLDAVSSRGSQMGSNISRYGFIGTGSEAGTNNGTTGPNHIFDGDISEIRVWNRAFSQSDIDEIYCPDRNDPDLLLWYNFTEGSGTVVNDLSSFGHHGNMVNMESGDWQSGDRPGCFEVYNDYTSGADASGTYSIGSTAVNWNLITPEGTAHSCTQTITVNQADPEAVCEEEFNDYIWTGNSDSDWSNTLNWVDSAVPPTNANVTIDTEVHNPEVGNSIELNNLLIKAGSNIDFTSSFGNIRLNGDLVNNGALNLAEGKITFQGDDLQFIKGENTPIFNDLRLNCSDTLRLITDIELFGALQPDNGVFDWNTREVTLRSDANRTGSIGEIKSDATILGDTITYQRFFPAGPGSWRMLCSPIKDATFEQWNDDIPTTGIPGSDYPTYGGSDPWANLRWYNETITTGDLHSGFEPVSNITDTIGNTRGVFTYFIPAPTTFDMRGAFHKGEVIYELNYTNSSTGFINDGWNLIANPYPSAINWTDLLGVTRENLDNAIYAYDPINGQYSSFINGISIGLLDNTIASGQAFWVKANANSPTLTLDEGAKVNTGGVFMRQQDMDTQTIVRIKLQTEAENIYDETVVGFHFGAQVEFDHELDAYKFFSGSQDLPSLASVPDTSSQLAMSIAMLPVPEEDMVIDLFMAAGGNDSLTIVNSMVDSYEGDLCFVLEDRELEAFVAFNAGDSYGFTVTDNTTENRFALHVSAPLDVMAFNESCADADDGSIIAQGFGEAPWNFTWYDEMGNVIREVEGSTTADVYEDLTPGFYEVLVENNSEQCSSATRIVQVETAPQSFIEPSSNVATCNQLNDGELALFASKDQDWSAIIAGSDGTLMEVENFTSDTVLTGLTSGIYEVIATNNCNESYDLGMIDLRDPMGVTAAASAFDDNVSMNDGGIVSFINSSSPNAVSFIWHFGDGVSDSTSVAPQHTYQQWGTYEVQLIAKNEVCADTTLTQVTITGLQPGGNGQPGDMAGLTDQEIAKGSFGVIVQADQLKLMPSEDIDGQILVQVFALSGALAISEELEGLSAGGSNINTSQLDSGLYTLSITRRGELIESREFIQP